MPDGPGNGNGARTREILTGALGRVEGEGAMLVRIRDGEVADVQLSIYEPPRFFEAFLRGRDITEVVDITARICGICPVAYQTSAAAAAEDALGISVPEGIRLLRRLLYCGEWIESHTLHVFLLHAPDFLGYPSGFAMAADHRAVVETALKIKKAGNALVRVIGGREIHPVNPGVGGFHRAPSRRELEPVAALLAECLEPAREAVRWTGGLDFPPFEEDYEFVALSDPGGYAIERGRLVSSRGLDIGPDEFEDHVVEEHVPHSTALHARLRDGGTYMVGPLARYALNAARLPDVAREAAADAGIGDVVRNPFQSIVVRMVEVLFAIDEALGIIERYEPPSPSRVTVAPRAGVGHGWSEAPRGMLYHRYALDATGTITEARIVPPTSQNQRAIERDLHEYVRRAIDLPDDELRHRCEQAIRNYDPCISCATHFLRLEVDRG